MTDKQPTPEQIKKICFRCGKPITDELYIVTLSKQDSHLHCQITGVKGDGQD
jgi:hypothetical protein